MLAKSLHKPNPECRPFNSIYVANNLDRNTLVSAMNIGAELAKPIDTFIKKVSSGIGEWYKPTGIVRTAKAEAKAQLIMATSDIMVTEVQRRAAERLRLEETTKQINMETIAQNAIPFLSNETKPELVEDDWIAKFFDKCRLTSDGEMQTIWSKILAGQANCPGSFSKRTIDIVSNLEQKDAKAFEIACSFVVLINEKPTLLFFEPARTLYPFNLTSIMMHLASVGLVQQHPVSLVTAYSGEELNAIYFDTTLHVSLRYPDLNYLPVGTAALTVSGEELYRVANPIRIYGFAQYVIEKWATGEYVTSCSLRVTENQV